MMRENNLPTPVICELLNHGCKLSYVHRQTWPTSLPVGVSQPVGPVNRLNLAILDWNPHDVRPQDRSGPLQATA